MRLWISSYSKANKGIYVVDFINEKMEIVNYIPTSDCPSYLLKRENFLYVTYRAITNGGVASFEIVDDKLINCKQVGHNKQSYTHLCLSNNILYAASYHEGTTDAFMLDETGAVDSFASQVIHNDSNHKNGQELSHIHYVGITADNSYLYSVDLGSDQIHLFKNQLPLELEHSEFVESGAGCRHIVYSDEHYYLANELNNTVTVFDSKFNIVQTIRTIPEDFIEFNAPGAIRVSSDGKYLFVTNRGYNSVVVYKIDKNTNLLTLFTHLPCKNFPRDINLIADKYLFIACQKDNCVHVYKMDLDKEEFISLNQYLEIDEPVCIEV